MLATVASRTVIVAAAARTAAACITTTTTTTTGTFPGERRARAAGWGAWARPRRRRLLQRVNRLLERSGRARGLGTVRVPFRAVGRCR
jgi:hypothetical protein